METPKNHISQTKMAMSTMLYHENPPLRNEAPVDLATTSPMPGRNRKVSEVCWMKIYTRPYHNNKTQLPKISQLPCHLHDLFHQC